MPQSLTRSPTFRPLLRVRNTSIDGNQKIAQSLSGIKGVGRRFAQAVLRVAGYDEEMRAGNLSDKDITKLETIIQNPLQYGIPVWMVNRQKDLRTGANLHISGTDVDLLLKMDIDRMKRTRSWKGVRHHLNLKVRGQRTRTTGRSGLIVGVVRKKKGQAVQQGKKAETPAKEGKKEKKGKKEEAGEVPTE
ncbi:MAG TPA: 30S ribosomal protein S13 [Candidatus Lokiarchaeia archaeon]|nr:30S ribosomal protein S13 [Candidatus Lokiarchaeia archaeon]